MIILQLTQKLDSRGNYGALGSIVRNMYDFLESGKDKEKVIQDIVNSEEVSAKEYFNETDYRFYVNSKRLPYEVNVKAAYINKNGKNSNKPILELGEIDFSALEEKLQGDYREGVKLRGRTIFSCGKTEEENSKLMSTITSRKYKRTGVIFTPELEDSYEIDLALQVADSMYNGNTFKENLELEEKVDRIVGTQQGRPKLEQVQELRQLLDIEQVQKMSLGVSQQQIQRYQITSMSTPQLLEKVANEIEEVVHAEEIIASVLRKRAIARIKNSTPGLSWSKATQIYHKLTNKSRGD